MFFAKARRLLHPELVSAVNAPVIFSNDGVVTPTPKLHVVLPFLHTLAFQCQDEKVVPVCVHGGHETSRTHRFKSDGKQNGLLKIKPMSPF